MGIFDIVLLLAGIAVCAEWCREATKTRLSLKSMLVVVYWICLALGFARITPPFFTGMAIPISVFCFLVYRRRAMPLCAVRAVAAGMVASTALVAWVNLMAYVGLFDAPSERVTAFPGVTPEVILGAKLGAVLVGAITFVVTRSWLSRKGDPT